MPSFIDTLRAGRSSRAAVLHEFLAQYNPHSKRVYAFFEGHDDIAFFSPHIEQQLPPGAQLLPYRCEGKGRVMEAFKGVIERIPHVQRTLFFVDKDLDDIVGTPWPTDPRIYVTDQYSIENYLVTAPVVARLYRDAIKLTNVSFDEESLIAHFEEALARFHRQTLSVMAWILVARRCGLRPLLSNVQMSTLCEVSNNCDIRARRGARMKCLREQTQVSLPPRAGTRIRDARRELSRLPPKRIVRGKFEAWFMVVFWRALVAELQRQATEAGGKCSARAHLTEDSFVLTLGRYLETPDSLRTFLGAHLAPINQVSVGGAHSAVMLPAWRRVLSKIFGH